MPEPSTGMDTYGTAAVAMQPSHSLHASEAAISWLHAAPQHPHQLVQVVMHCIMQIDINASQARASWIVSDVVVTALATLLRQNAVLLTDLASSCLISEEQRGYQHGRFA